ncbi:hypothetical protein ACIQOV_27295 [Kitasatospora sp. NPDC091257]|uniref:hypothetical protein n=1 Tax=unclassified Kitasatospora TaxID=2633591 RepID=UPI002F91561C
MAAAVLGRGGEPVTELTLSRDPSRTHGTPGVLECDAAVRRLAAATGWTRAAEAAPDGVLVALGLREGYDLATATHSPDEGTDFEISASSTPARELWDVWSWRQRMMKEDGVPQRPGLANAVARLREAGEGRVRLGIVRSPDTRFIAFLSDDLQTCVACV